MRIVGRGYKAGRFTYGCPSGTGRIFGRPKAVASIGGRSNGQISVRDRTYRLEGFGDRSKVWGLGTGPTNRPVKRQVTGI
jgi:hypothetical protein